jgi:hypothetical protein
MIYRIDPIHNHSLNSTGVVRLFIRLRLMQDMDGVARGRDSVDSKLGFYCILYLVIPCSSIDDALHLISSSSTLLMVVKDGGA